MLDFGCRLVGLLGKGVSREGEETMLARDPMTARILLLRVVVQDIQIVLRVEIMMLGSLNPWDKRILTYCGPNSLILRLASQ